MENRGNDRRLRNEKCMIDLDFVKFLNCYHDSQLSLFLSPPFKLFCLNRILVMIAII